MISIKRYDKRLSFIERKKIMEPIIPPMWIYLIHLASTLRFMAIYTLCASIIISLYIYAGAIDLIRDSNKKFWLKTFAIAIIVCVLILMLIPDKDTLYAMIAASFITPDNISIGEEHLIDLITKITKIIYNASK